MNKQIFATNGGSDDKNKATHQVGIAYYWIISFAFVIWGAFFISETSIIGIDGKRYFSLFDDAMISMRYAWNFSHGEGLVWNSGEYIQGYTNLLMTLLMSLATFIFSKSNAVLAVQIAGILFMLAIACVSKKIADHLIIDVPSQSRALVSIFAFLCPLLYFPLAYWTLMGMETGLLTMLILLGVLATLNYTESDNPKYMLLVALYFGLAYLTRNDAVIFAMLAWSYIAYNILKREGKYGGIAKMLPSISLYFLFIMGQLVFQYTYYGEFLPNTYTLKLTGMPFDVRIDNGIGFILPFLSSIVFVLMVSAIHLIMKFQMKKLLLMSIFFAAISYQIYVGGDAWVYWRILAPSMPLLFILFIFAVTVFSNRLFNSIKIRDNIISNPIRQRKFYIGICTVLLMTAGLVSANAAFLPEMFFLSKPYQVEDNRINVNTAIALKSVTKTGATIGVFWAGTLPYYSGLRAFDFLGKSDRYISHLAPDVSGLVSWNGMNSVPGHNKYDLNYSIKELLPTYIQKYRWGSQDLSEFIKAKYVAVRVADGGLFLNRDSPEVLWEKLQIID